MVGPLDDGVEAESGGLGTPRSGLVVVVSRLVCGRDGTVVALVVGGGTVVDDPFPAVVVVVSGTVVVVVAVVVVTGAGVVPAVASVVDVTVSITSFPSKRNGTATARARAHRPKPSTIAFARVIQSTSSRPAPGRFRVV